MQDFSYGDLNIKTRKDGAEVIRVDWLGKSNSRQPASVLAPYFEELMKTAQSVRQPIEMHFEEIEHFNSSTITALIQLIQKLGQVNLRLSLVYNPRLKWQKLSFDALKVFQKPDGLLEIRENAPSAS